MLPKIITLLFIIGSIALADIVPTIHQIYKTVQAGHLDDAHRMVEQVLKVHPDSAKAHFANAEILVQLGDIRNAKNELATAEKLSPGLHFAKPESIINLKQSILGVSANELTISPSQSNDKPLPWMIWIITTSAVLLMILIVKSIFFRKLETYPSQGNREYTTVTQGYPMNNTSVGAGQTYSEQSTGIGSGIASGLATGAAAGVSIVAGEALMHHVMDDSSSANMNNLSSANTNSQSSNDMAEKDFTVTDSSSWDDTSTSNSFSDSGDDT